MAPNIVDRAAGLRSSAAIKAPVKALADSDIALEGLQTIDDVVLADGDRVLVAGKSDQTLNGIYIASSSDWSRAPDFSRHGEVVRGTRIWVASGTVYGETEFVQETEDVVFGTDFITFVPNATSLNSGILSTTIHGAPNKAVPDDEDEVGIWNSLTGLLSRLNLLNLWLYIKSIADLVYQPVDADLSLIASSSTQPYGRSLLTVADAAAARTLLGIAPQFLSVGVSANQNNYVIAGVEPKASRKTILNVTPTISMKFTGVDTTGWEAGKELVIRNVTSEDGADGRLIICETNSALSSAANRFASGKRHLPIMLMPGDEITFRFDGTNLRVLSQTTTENGNAFGFTGSAANPSVGDALSVGGGTGAVAVIGEAFQDSLGNVFPIERLDTGTTTTGHVTDIVSGAQGVCAGRGALLFIATVAPLLLSTAAQEFDLFVGFHDGPLSGNNGIPTNGIFWLYDRNTSVNWQCKTLLASPAGNTVVGSGVAVAAERFDKLGIFVNGNGTRAEFFYSTDNGVTWNFVATAITTNLSNAAFFSAGNGIKKSAGTTSVSLLVRSLFYKALNY